MLQILENLLNTEKVLNMDLFYLMHFLKKKKAAVFLSSQVSLLSSVLLFLTAAVQLLFCQAKCSVS